MFDELVDFDFAFKADGVFGNTEIRVRENIGGFGGTCHEDRLAFVFLLDFGSANIYGDFCQLVECVGVEDGIVFIVPKNGKTDDEQD